MGSLNQVVDIVISRESKGITRQGFGTMMILGLHTRFAERIRFYSSLEEVDADFQTSDAEYLAAARAFAQRRKPSRVAIGRRTVAVAQVITFTPTVLDNTLYTVTINGTLHSYTSDSDATASEIVAALIAAINGGAQSSKVTASGTTTLIVTADNAGEPFTYESTVNLVSVVTTANNGIQEDILAVMAANSSDWYGMILTSRLKYEILLAAATIETLDKIYMTCNEDADVLLAPVTDVAGELNARAYDRTSFLYSSDQESYPDSGWMGGQLTFDPGSNTWAFKESVGSLPDNLSTTSKTNLTAKKANWYDTIAGRNVFLNGTVASGEFIDIIVGTDWLKARIQEDIFERLANLPKIPMTNAGLGIIENIIRARLNEGKRVGLLNPDSEPIITIPEVNSIPLQDRQARIASGIEFEDQLAGAVHKVVIRGRVFV